MFFFYYNWFFRWVFSKMTWRKETENKIIYLTFDDGPIPEVTEWVLDELQKVNAKATFFCVGENIFKYADIYQKVKKAQHKTANHTYNHLKGWETSLDDYLKNVDKCEEQLTFSLNENKLFRPPHGRLTSSQANKIREKGYEIIMWEVLSADFSPKVSKEKCLHKSIKHTKKGSIIVFHDSVKTIEKLKYVLPRYLKHFSQLGYSFETL